jgi:hypothetical protein
LRDEAKELVGHGVLLVVADIDVDDLIAVEQIGQLAPHVRSLLEVVHELRIVRDAVEPGYSRPNILVSAGRIPAGLGDVGDFGLG